MFQTAFQKNAFQVDAFQIVSIGSYFRVSPIGTATVATVGN